MWTLQDFHDECASGNISGIKRFHYIDKLYDDLDKNENLKMKKDKIANGLFWALLCGKFDTAKYLISSGIFDPTEMFCGEIHILHLLATFGGRDTDILQPWQASVCVLLNILTINSNYMPSMLGLDTNGYSTDEFIIKYDESDILDFTNWLLDNYDIDVSIKTNHKWYLLKDDSHASAWYKFYKNIIFYAKKQASITYDCYNLTPFHYACLFGRRAFVELLVLRGCDLLCAGCNNICMKCPYNMITFHDYDDMDGVLDDYYEIRYPPDSPDDIEIQLHLINDYIREEVSLILFEEMRKIRPTSLQFNIIENITENINEKEEEEEDEEYNKILRELPQSMYKDIKCYVNIKCHSAKPMQYALTKER